MGPYTGGHISVGFVLGGPNVRRFYKKGCVFQMAIASALTDQKTLHYLQAEQFRDVVIIREINLR